MQKDDHKVVLSIDGGGIKGIVPLVILDHVIEKLKAIDRHDVLQDVIDLFAGSSTGSIICAALMHKKRNGQVQFDVRQLLVVYLSEGNHVFKREFSDA